MCDMTREELHKTLGEIAESLTHCEEDHCQNAGTLLFVIAGALKHELDEELVLYVDKWVHLSLLKLSAPNN
jgi:hypothetical protein